MSATATATLPHCSLSCHDALWWGEHDGCQALQHTTSRMCRVPCKMTGGGRPLETDRVCGWARVMYHAVACACKLGAATFIVNAWPPTDMCAGAELRQAACHVLSSCAAKHSHDLTQSRAPAHHTYLPAERCWRWCPCCLGAHWRQCCRAYPSASFSFSGNRTPAAKPGTSQSKSQGST